MICSACEWEKRYGRIASEGHTCRDTVEEARALARSEAANAMRGIIKLAEERPYPRNAGAALAAYKCVLEVAGVNEQMTAERAVETLLEAIRPLVDGGAYAALIRAYATVRGVVAQPSEKH